MLKKILIALSIIVGIVILAVAALFISSWASRPKTDKEFLSKLKGEVVFTRRNAEGISDIWKINANGTGETMLYHNDKDKTRTTFPYWSLDGSKIYFLMYDMATEKKEIYEVDTDGKNIRVVKKIKQKFIAVFILIFVISNFLNFQVPYGKAMMIGPDPTGINITGQVTDLQTQNPLANVTVKLLVRDP